ncbi:hypothetical protein VOLCADRAFT_108304 [Volvox carteri f. nagariensis]|uniref:Coenzyme Q-binding protein COQ10 START domain-containing protein n=1 Tax=Volvox carteri f. nagariensis TaxID=3068 RepID=D8UJC7_VOLCA|nr:uncharacterized protein VOLCADRAFT_108304 [Volvox carteri f. nagariensis]EFJ40166.1 hypothetical protein VOLCADRAFT_108304 [Volvox carteri f. nagariensis]|eukprot:XP_002958776.1 hypothetical protein VOLCADRAFT_108304 [Volvox carteri f. nagariensis]
MAKEGSQAGDSQMDTQEAWNEKGQTITVSEGNGALYNLTLRAKIDSKPTDIYRILIDPNTVSIFRSIKECTYRRVLEDDGKGRRKLEVGHRALTRFLFISVTFETHLHVWEDDNERTIKFQMARPSMMQKFDGCWRIKPFTQETLDSIYHPERLQRGDHHHKQQHHFHGFGPFNAAGLLGFLHHHQHHYHPAVSAAFAYDCCSAGAPEPTESLVTLEQSILPRGPVPPGVKGLVRGLCAHQIRCMMDDLRAELQRRKEGTSTTTTCGTIGPETQLAPAAAGAEFPKKGKAVVTSAASLTLAPLSLWSRAAPINITIHLLEAYMVCL